MVFSETFLIVVKLAFIKPTFLKVHLDYSFQRSDNDISEKVFSSVMDLKNQCSGKGERGKMGN